MRRTQLLLTLLLGSSLLGCEKDPCEENPLQCSNGGGGGNTTGGTETDTSGGTGSTSGSTGAVTEPDEYFDDVGDVVAFEDRGGEAEINLTDYTGDESSEDQEFYLILVNTSENAVGYQARYITPSPEDTGDTNTGTLGPDTASPDPGTGTGTGGDPGGGTSGGGEGGTAPSPLMSPKRAILDHALATRRIDRATRSAEGPPPPAYASSDVGVSSQNFHVRSSLDTADDYETITATLWAVGETVTIWVDDDLPIDWDYECDGTVDEAVPDGGAYGFDNCDLETISDIVDTNIVPNVTAAFGDLSDVNEDSRLSVVITPVLNAMTAGTSDDELKGELVRSYADPEVDLNDFDISSNAGSDEQEVIFVFAPDPYGFVNNRAPVTVEDYTALELAAEISRALVRLISYNIQVLIAEDIGEEASEEETWIVEGLGALAADITGFGAGQHEAVWDYIDTINLSPIIDTSDTNAISTATWGPQYLFFRYLLDVYGEDLLPQLMITGNTGEDNVKIAVNAVRESSDGTSTATFEDIVLQFQVAMLTTGVTNSKSKEALVDADSYPPFAGAEFISAATENPTSGDLYGANGYQQGIQLPGENVTIEGGTTSSPSEVAGTDVVLGNSDFVTLTSGLPFYGYVEGNYASHVVRLTDVPYDEVALEILGRGSGFLGAVVRWNDPEQVDTEIEFSLSSTEATNLSLPELPDDGEAIYAIGELADPGYTLIPISDKDTSEATVYDTDRWLLDLSDRPITESVNVAIQLQRHYEDPNGDIGPYDPWVAVVQASLVPTPTVDGTVRGECDDGGYEFAYPSTVLDYLYYQVFLSGFAMGDSTEISDGSESGGTTGGSSGGSSGGSGSTGGTGGTTTGGPGGGGTTGAPPPGVTGTTGGASGGSTGGSTGGGGGGAFDPCGTVSTDTTCAEDWDRDGVLDTDEPLPSDFIRQVQVMQCTLNGGTLDHDQAMGEEILDIDETDEDEDPWFDRSRDLGGATGSSGEEAFLEIELTGGTQYLIVVGAGTDTGVYELEIREVEQSTPG